MPKHAKILAVTVFAAAALVLCSAGPAGAHVTVTSSSTSGGGSAVLTFKVPVESATARTVGLTVHLPAAPAFTSVLSTPVPGWRVALTRTPLGTPVEDDDGDFVTSAVTEVTWTATAGGLAPGQFGEFPLSVGPLPADGTLYLPTVQRYSDGTRVNWVQQAQGSAEPEHPAPSVVITPAPTATGSGTAAGSAGGSGDGWGIGLGAAGIALALAAGAAGGAALTRTRRSPLHPPTAPAPLPDAPEDGNTPTRPGGKGANPTETARTTTTDRGPAVENTDTDQPTAQPTRVAETSTSPHHPAKNGTETAKDPSTTETARTTAGQAPTAAHTDTDRPTAQPTHVAETSTSPHRPVGNGAGSARAAS
jgi:uncharacterized protein YcnI